MKNTSSIRTTIAALCCSLLLFTLIGLLGTISAIHAAPVASTPTSTSTSTPSATATTPTTTPSPTPTDTPSPTPTDTPSPTPTNTPSPTPTRTRPTPTPTQPPAPTATQPSGGQVLPTATPAAKPTAGTSATPTASNGGGMSDQTPTVFPGTGPTPPSRRNSTPASSGSSKAAGGTNAFLFTFGGILTGIVVLAAAAILLVRKFLIPVPATKVNLPPSGARPWSRTRGDSLDGNTNLYGWGSAANTPQQASMNADPFGAQAVPGYAGFADVADTPFQVAEALETPMAFQNIPSTDPGWIDEPATQNDLNMPSAAPGLAFAQPAHGFAPVPDSQQESEVNWSPGVGWGTGSNWGVWPADVQEQSTRPSVPALPTVPTTPRASATGSLRAVRASRLQAIPQPEAQQSTNTR